MELRHLKYFVAVADCLSFSRAAENLFVSQSTLSHQIGELEKELGVQLFAREGHSVYLTTNGASILEQAKLLLRQADDIAERAKAPKHMRENHRLVVGYDPFAASNPTVRRQVTVACTRMKQKHTYFEVFYLPVTQNGFRDELNKRRIDIAIVQQSKNKTPEGINSILISQDELIYATVHRESLTDETQSLRELIEGRILYYPERETYGSSIVTSLINKNDIHPNIRFHDSLETVNLIVSSGEGGMIIPSYTPKANSGVKYHRFGDCDAQLFTLAMWQENNMNCLIQEFIGEVQNDLH